MSCSYCIALAMVAIFLLFILQKLLTKNDYWTQHGIEEITCPNFLQRFFKTGNYIEKMTALYKELGDMKYAGLHDSGKNIVFIKDLDFAKQVYVKDFEHFVNKDFLKDMVTNDKVWNNMLVNKVDKEWKDLRALVSPTFTTGKLRHMFPILSETSDKFTMYITKTIEEKKQLNVEDVLGYFCIDAITSLAFGIDSDVFKNQNSILAEMAKKIVLVFTPFVFLRYLFFSYMPNWIRKFSPPLINPEANAFFTKMMGDTINHREKSGERRNDFLQLMIDTKHGQLKKDEHDTEMTSHEKDAQLKIGDNNIKKFDMNNELIIANSMMFVLGGFDTTRTAMTFAAYSLAVNPDIQEKLNKELQDAVEENGGNLSYDIINTHEYLDKCISESLRMYPPGVRSDRLCTKDYPIPGTKSFIPKDSVMWLSMYVIHHDEKYFPNPAKFDPERFSPEVKAKRHPYAYMPFGHGPRSCIANRFALLMTKSAIASLVLNFYIEPTAETDIPIQLSDSLLIIPSKPTHLKLKPRK